LIEINPERRNRASITTVGESRYRVHLFDVGCDCSEVDKVKC